jgi:two-component system, LytTR family, sensor histidine kinase AlgZ
VYVDTLRGLIAPKRLVPILLVAFPVIMLQKRLSDTPDSVPLAIAMCLAFVLLAPAAFRALLPTTGAAPAPERRIGGAVAYAALGLVVVGVVGIVVPRVFAIAPTILTTPSSLAVCVALFWVGGWGLARDIDMELHMQRETRRADAMQSAAKHAELLALQQHFDPHFLFNTLNALAEWCREDPSVAERGILELSSVLRTVMGAIRKPMWSLEEELQLALHVFALHLLRDPERFFVRFECDPAFNRLQVPPMLLLPLAENAMKHGPEAGHRGEVALLVGRTGAAEHEGCLVYLSNPGSYLGRRRQGEGIAHVEERLKLAYGQKASLEITTERSERTAARVHLPMQMRIPGRPQ